MRISDWSSDVFSSDLGKAQIVTFSAAFSERAELCGHIINGIVHELEQRIGIASVNALKLSMTADWGTPPRIEAPRPARQRQTLLHPSDAEKGGDARR